MLSLPPRSLAKSTKRRTASGPPAEHVGDVVIAQVAVKAVAAEKGADPGRELDAPRIDLDVFAVADRARDDISMRRFRGLLRRNEPLLQLPRDERMVFGELLDAPPDDPINSAVAHLMP